MSQDSETGRRNIDFWLVTQLQHMTSGLLLLVRVCCETLPSPPLIKPARDMEELKLEKRYKSLKVGRTRAGHDFFLFPFGLAARLIGSTSADLMPDGTGKTTSRYMR